MKRLAAALDRLIVLLAVFASAGCWAADPSMLSLRGKASYASEDLLFLDKGNLSPFLIAVASGASVKGCPRKSTSELLIRVVDFGEINDAAIYCVVGISEVRNVMISRVEDSESQIGVSALVNITYVKERRVINLRIRVTPWFAKIESETLE